MTERTTSLLRYYFSIGLRKSATADRMGVPSFEFHVACYLFRFYLELNYPAMYAPVFQTKIGFCAIPKRWDIRKLSNGDIAWRFASCLPFGKRRWAENLLAERLS